MLVVVAKYHDLEQANTKVFSEQFQPNGLAENYKRGAKMEPINQVALQQDQHLLVFSKTSKFL
jgi:hypothetical protein